MMGFILTVFNDEVAQYKLITFTLHILITVKTTIKAIARRFLIQISSAKLLLLRTQEAKVLIAKYNKPAVIVQV